MIQATFLVIGTIDHSPVGWQALTRNLAYALRKRLTMPHQWRFIRMEPSFDPLPAMRVVLEVGTFDQGLYKALERMQLRGTRRKARGGMKATMRLTRSEPGPGTVPDRQRSPDRG